MINYNKIREQVAENQHEAWMHWSKSLSEELRRVDSLIGEKHSDLARETIRIRLKRWEKNWKPYKKLLEETKDFDRVWADKILDTLPHKCPVYQCSGIMKRVERRYPKGKTEDDFPDGTAGDSQLPDLICTNCGAVYSFQKFRRLRG